ncbi:alpha/beta hydrolase [Paraburkholderia sp. J8-2]|uniref:alpha/beta fold hydrolase n=1 Tax=Paraburkholderia sp. J8-2 TaxID=2805440 RepID=UPI002AB7881A|nr:alpha/beta hydrolase [Paraburkholderia sp. J8-2]
MPLRTERFKASGGMTLAADVGGSIGEPPVVLLHGGGQTRYSWGRAAADLARRGHHVISLDLRGHGESDWAAGADYSIDAFVADLDAVVATLERAPVLIGASLGGATALVATGELRGDFAQALVLVDVVPRMEAEGVGHIRDFMRANLHGFASVDEAADAVARYLPDRPRPASNEGLMKNLREHADGRLYWHWDPAFQTGPIRIQPDAMTARMEAAARRIGVPTLLVRGKASNVVSDEGARRLLDLIPQAQYVDVEGAGHMVAGDRNDAFNEAIEDFLAALA